MKLLHRNTFVGQRHSTFNSINNYIIDLAIFKFYETFLSKLILFVNNIFWCMIGMIKHSCLEIIFIMLCFCLSCNLKLIVVVEILNVQRDLLLPLRILKQRLENIKHIMQLRYQFFIVFYCKMRTFVY